MNNSRRKSSVVQIGKLAMGGENPVRVQSMLNTNTMDTVACVEQAIRIIEAGGELVRLTAQGVREAENLKNIKAELTQRGYGDTPLVADIHFNPATAEVAAQYVEKVRINPGNFVKSIKKDLSDYTDEEFEQERLLLKEKFIHFLNICKKHNTAIRVGVNHGSLSERMMNRYGDTPLGMVESCLEILRICREESFEKVVISLKSSNTVLMVQAVRLLAERMCAEDFHFPLHLGVTEAGDGEDGRLKSAIGIGALLVDGIGDTIRVSLSEDPENEIPVAFGILQATRTRITKTEYISCPGCGRTLYDLQSTIKSIKQATSHLTGLKIGIMGCIVNGPGEMADADYGYVGAGKGKVYLYKGKECMEKNIPEEEAVEHLIALIKKHGDWKD
ncbi:MAG: (E)-4-hydroxy-3-methylbut-2-enyl-diphosphate synthase [Dysgonamonadaceae bacterium]|jgi:(E)-4-hydroxy-3-methylbut-2-enyl-diphosphate synthase|nr:(E)-4-hydroxy-3-methylbut-2-enyl-diphosphate synthase [Dysgonamonadaceae bacterium]